MKPFTHAPEVRSRPSPVSVSILCRSRRAPLSYTVSIASFLSDAHFRLWKLDLRRWAPIVAGATGAPPRAQSAHEVNRRSPPNHDREKLFGYCKWSTVLKMHSAYAEQVANRICV
jgi:hypothetical protein